jgi:hypothetical protein
MGSGSTDTPSDGFKSLLDINHQTPLNGRNVNPFAILIQYLQSASVVLREKCKKTSRVLVRPDALRVRCRPGILHKLQSAHLALEGVECVCWKSQALRHEVDKPLGQSINLGNVFLHQILRARGIGILFCWSICETAEDYPSRNSFEESPPGWVLQVAPRMGPGPSIPSCQGFQSHIAGRISLHELKRGRAKSKCEWVTYFSDVSFGSGSLSPKTGVS